MPSKAYKKHDSNNIKKYSIFIANRENEDRIVYFCVSFHWSSYGYDCPYDRCIFKFVNFKSNFSSALLKILKFDTQLELECD